EQVLPPSLHMQATNPKIDFAHSPFVVNDTLRAWPHSPQPRRAGVSSFGVGGTNAHVIMEEAPQPAPSDAAQGPQLLF
ncbi:ketoacyl-synthetase C-terminal extension domain-containing protein, partial [Salmonella enterica]